MANLWFKFYGTEYLSDQKIERLNPVERSCWITLLCLASVNETGKIKHLTVQTLLNKSGVQFDPYHPEQWEEALSIFEKLEMLEMIQRVDVGTIVIKNWEKRQEHNLTVAERVAKSRAKKKAVTSNVTNVTTEKNRIEKNRIDINTNTGAEAPPLDVQSTSSKKFKKPSLEEVIAYCTERKNTIDASNFIDHYDSNGWKIGGKSAMKDWKAAIRTWEKNNFSKPVVKKDNVLVSSHSKTIADKLKEKLNQ